MPTPIALNIQLGAVKADLKKQQKEEDLVKMTKSTWQERLQVLLAICIHQHMQIKVPIFYLILTSIICYANNITVYPLNQWKCCHAIFFACPVFGSISYPCNGESLQTEQLCRTSNLILTILDTFLLRYYYKCKEEIQEFPVTHCVRMQENRYTSTFSSSGWSFAVPGS